MEGEGRKGDEHGVQASVRRSFALPGRTWRTHAESGERRTGGRGAHSGESGRGDGVGREKERLQAGYRTFARVLRVGKGERRNKREDAKSGRQENNNVKGRGEGYGVSSDGGAEARRSV